MHIFYIVADHNPAKEAGGEGEPFREEDLLEVHDAHLLQAQPHKHILQLDEGDTFDKLNISPAMLLEYTKAVP